MVVPRDGVRRMEGDGVGAQCGSVRFLRLSFPRRKGGGSGKLVFHVLDGSGGVVNGGKSLFVWSGRAGVYTYRFIHVRSNRQTSPPIIPPSIPSIFIAQQEETPERPRGTSERQCCV